MKTMANICLMEKLSCPTAHRVSAWLALVGWGLVCLSGCGGIDQNDMRRYALNRPSDDELETSKPPAPKPSPPSTTPPKPAKNAATGSNNLPTLASAVAVQHASPPSPSPPSDTQGADAQRADKPLSDTRSPNAGLSVTERRQISIDNLTRIAEAFEQYLKAKGTYPPQTVRNTAGQPLYSWRVALLPFLGYESLYQAFEHDEPWNSRHNQKLMRMIPSVYQSPERFDTRTNYLVPVGSSTAFTGRTTLPPRRWEDGAENTVILIEVDDSLAVEWTQPLDYSVNAKEPTAGLGGLRGDGCFTVWGGGAVSLVPASISVKNARAMFSIDGGEAFSSYTVCKPATASVAAARSAPSPTPRQQTGGDTLTMTTTRTPLSTGSDLPHSIEGTGATVGKLTQRAIDAFQAGYESEGLDFLMLAYLMDEPSTSIDYRWIPALRRPAFAVRYGVGVQYSGPHLDRLDRLKVTSQSQPHDWSRHSQKIRSVSGDLAARLLDFLETTPRFLPAVFQSEPDKARPGQPKPRGIEFLGVANRQTILAAARRQNCDVVVSFEIRERKSRSGKEIREANVRLVDAISRRDLFVSPEVNSVRRKEKLGTPLYDDPVEKALRQFELLISEKLQPQAIPSALRPQHAAKRVAGFRRSSDESPLKTLCEIRFYHQRELLNVEQALAAYRNLLGEDAGLRMLAGKPELRSADLAPWTPTVRIAEQPRKPANRKDNDD